LRFLGSQIGEHQLRKTGLPRESFGLVHGQLQHVFVDAERFLEFMHDLVLRVVELLVSTCCASGARISWRDVVNHGRGLDQELRSLQWDIEVKELLALAVTNASEQNARAD